MGAYFGPPIELPDGVVQDNSAAGRAERPAGLVEETDVRLNAHRISDGIDAWLDLDPRPGQHDRSVPRLRAVDDLSVSLGFSPGNAGAPEAAGGIFELVLLLVESRAQVGLPGAAGWIHALTV